MKHIIAYSAIAAGLLLGACTKLDVPIESEYTDGNFPNTTDAYVAATGPAYTQLATRYAVDYWRMQELSTDEAIIPARDGNYNDNGQYRFLHKHTWSPDHPTVRGVWEWGFGGINTCNRIISLFESTADTKEKRQAIAEMRTMRALYHFFMMDLYANIPIVTTFGSTTAPAQKTRPEVFAFIEKELKESLPDLNTASGAVTYGRPTKWMAFALLAKLYINAKVYTGTEMNKECIAMTDSIISKGPYKLDADFISIFMPENGPQITETIFAIPYDANKIPGCQFSRFGLHTGLQTKFSLPFRPSIALSTIADFYEKFNLAGDVRNTTWLAGKQYNSDGSPILIPSTNKGVDASYSGPNPNDKINWHLEFSPEMPLKNVDQMDVGNDELGKARGVRSIKYYPDRNTNPDTRFSNNDVPVFRLADIILMKAEAILRDNNDGVAAAALVSEIRRRAKAPEVSTITLEELLDERGRELAWEAWRRNDLIRFGAFEGSWGFKNDTDPNKRIYPIPTSERTLNPSLEQNQGY
ncbi:RagB/SusD family nutrient uptake outer membrane protein [Chitinophaga rhizophila]|uniref:RagB/SusD family nutrient uptake outer membrane protein n=1 Tax=Chitinophaga rhizophila TaxID=2866212 RepID=A0ABS7GF51_9BACT|nr:RagB/SusD family nutrient uptake outer membrane protein [Chitinophaga rhizophila]MBW8686313.1 RagB/SusD family nutrient uptake outer membrane protein [Chitinophaga rhizophila]